MELRDTDQTMDELMDGPAAPRTDLSSGVEGKQSTLTKTDEAPKFTSVPQTQGESRREPRQTRQH